MDYGFAMVSNVFFFSSRRRHTRFKCDWSSDVCSSDLDPAAVTIVFLALLTLIEGVRRVPRGSVVLHRVLFGPWTVEPPEAGERVRLLAWWSPLTSAIVLAPRQKYRRTDPDAVRAQLEGRDVYTALFDLRVLGIVELLALVLGVPFALQRFGALGFFAALGAVLLLCLTIFAALAFSAHGLGKPWRDRKST